MEIGNRDNLVQLQRDIQAHRVVLDKSAKEVELQILEDSRSVSQNRPHTSEQKAAMNVALDGTLFGVSFEKVVATYKSTEPVD